MRAHGVSQDLRGPTGNYGGQWRPLGTYGGDAYGDLWGPMGTFGDLWGPMATYGDLCGPMGEELLGCLETYGAP